MTAYKNKGMSVNYLLLVFVFFVIFFAIRFFIVVYELRDQMHGNGLFLAVIEIIIITSICGSLIYIMLNIWPRKITIDKEKIEVIFLCSNRICFEKKDCKILKYNEDNCGWWAVLYVKRKVFLIGSGSFPSLKRKIFKKV